VKVGVSRARELLAALETARAENPDSAGALDLEIAFLSVGAETVARVPEDWRERARDRLARGELALDVDELDLDPSDLVRLATAMCRVGSELDPGRASAFAGVRSYLADPDPGPPPRDVDTALLGRVVARVVRRCLVEYAVAVGALVATVRWRRGDCPLCGAAPDFAALTEDEGGRRLLCSRCDTEWPFPRSGCPFCHDAGRGSQGYYPVEGGAYRLYVCDRCHRYLKTVDLRATWHRRPLPVERVLTAALDAAAVSRGYRSA
jgi:formate dehydrogenase formation protein